MPKSGVVYILRNDEHVPNRYKVGQTYHLEKRIDDLNRETSNVGKFSVVASFPVSDSENAEKECHQALASYRIGKEFFDGPWAEIVEIVEKTAAKYNPKPFIRDGEKLIKEFPSNNEDKSSKKEIDVEVDKDLSSFFDFLGPYKSYGIDYSKHDVFPIFLFYMANISHFCFLFMLAFWSFEVFIWTISPAEDGTRHLSWVLTMLIVAVCYTVFALLRRRLYGQVKTRLSLKYLRAAGIDEDS